MDIKKLKIEYLPVEDLEEYKNNTRKHGSEDVDQIVKSIEKFGFDDPIGIWSDHNVIVEGHGRLMAAKKLGMNTVPCIRLDHLTDEERREYGIMHNRTAELSDWDIEKLTKELEDLDLGDFDIDFGNGDPNMPSPENEPVVEDKTPAPKFDEEPKSKVGDIYKLGNHTLICGDCTDPVVIRRLVGNNKIKLLLTDPPYNVNLGSTPTPAGSNIRPILNDSMEESKFIEFLTSALQNADEVMEPGAAYYIWYAGLHHIEFESAIRNISDFKLHEQLVWVKSHFVFGRNSDYQWMHEPCLYGWKSGAAHYFTDSRSEGTVIEDKSVQLSTLKKDELIELCEKLMGLDTATTVLRAGKPMSADLHPTVKPQELLTTLLKNSTMRDWNVLDMFGGSGSTLIACEQLHRKCFMCELDPHYVDVIIKRWEDFTGRKAHPVTESGEIEGQAPFDELEIDPEFEEAIDEAVDKTRKGRR